MNTSPFNTKKWTRLTVMVLSLALLWIGFSATTAGADGNADLVAPKTGFFAPDFTLSTLDGGSITLSDLQGQVVLVNLWASWCAPCRAEMPAIESVYQQYKDQGFTVLAVNSTSEDSVSAAQDFVAEYGFTFPTLLDTQGQVARAYLLNAYPSSYFIDRNGVIQEVVFGGPMAEALLRTRVEALLENN